MPTFASLIRRFALHDRRGASAIEFGLIVPILMLAVGGVTELGAYFQQTGAVEKGLRSAAMYASRADLPLSSGTINKVKQIARTGKTSGGTDTIPGWSNANASIIVSVKQVTSGGTTVSVVEVHANVPFTPIVPIFDQLARTYSLKISATQQQAHIGG